MKRMILCWIGIALAGTSYVQPASQQESSPATPASSSQRALLNRYCVTCHNEKLKTADLLLDQANIENVGASAAVWEKVVKKLRTGSMPPPGMPRPDKSTYDAFATYLETALDGAAAAKPNPGRPAAHRLNRSEYANAIRDLLAVEIDGEALLPPDEASNGFDNDGDVLSVSPLLMERYLLAAGKISRLSIGDTGMRPGSEEYKVPQNMVQNDRQSEDLPFGSRGGAAIHHNFPVDGEYVIRIRLQKNDDGFIRGLTEEHPLDVRLDGARVKLFTVGGVHKGKSGPMFTRNDPDYRGDIEQLEYEMSGDENLEVRFPAKAGSHVLGVTFLKKVSQAEGVYMPPMLLDDMRKFRGGDPVLDTVTILGPYNTKGPGDTPSRRKIFVCQPAGGSQPGKSMQQVSLKPGNDAGNGNSNEACARKILSTLARRAYRRPVTAEDVDTLVKLYRVGSEDGFETGIAMAMQRMLSGPEFLFRIERDPAGATPGTPYRISDLELASRLSFFLWSSIPDDELLDAAERGKLKDPAVLEQQVRRMFADPRAKSMVDNFGGQWLSLRNIKAISPDPKVFPDFDEELRDAFRQESILFFESQLREDHSALDLLNANYTFVNERLAKQYGIPNIYGSRFRRVTLSDDMRRGLLGEGNYLAITSRTTRTSPVLRGKWVLDNLLGAPPPPPPPNIPALKEKGENGKLLTMRQQMEAHRANPACAICHSRMDPIGFALDNFDATGKWRTTDAGSPLDVSGVMPDGTKFQGPVELRQALLSRPQQYVNTVTEKLLTYALGRGIEASDEPAVRKIVREAAASEYRWSSLVLGTVKSMPFQMRKSAEPTTTTAGLR